MLKILFIFGTRPEAIKMAPLIKMMKSVGNDFHPVVCITSQHREMLGQVMNFFSIEPDYDLDLMKNNQTLFDITANGLVKVKDILDVCNADMIFVQGDTTTAFIGALAGYYMKIPVAHLEAGLRSFKKYAPYPEEVNRKLISVIAEYHFAPTEQAVKNLSSEGIVNNVWNVGNTVIDALFMADSIIENTGSDQYEAFFNFLDFSKRIILVTGHRREIFGLPFENICNALGDIADSFPDIEIVYPVHLNPNIGEPVTRILSGKKNIHLIKPLDYHYLIWLMKRSYFVLTDSGGIQEEAPSFGKPVLVMRDVTERTEGIEAGTAKLVGTDYSRIVREVSQLLSNHDAYLKMSHAVNPYGNGTASQRIVAIFNNILPR